MATRGSANKQTCLPDLLRALHLLLMQLEVLGPAALPLPGPVRPANSHSGDGGVTDPPTGPHPVTSFKMTRLLQA